jgi:AhpD family alkylhydroperoxidase
MTSCDWLARAFLYINPSNGLLAHVDLDFAELVWLVVSQDNSCRYCYAAHRTFLQLIGYPEARIRELEGDFFTAELDERERLALQHARRISRANPPLATTDLQGMLDAGFQQPELDELAVLTTSIIFANRSVTLLAIPPQPMEQVFERWYFRLARPLLARIMGSRRKQGQPDFLEPGEHTGPFGYLVRSLDGLPSARPLRRLIDAAWASDTVSPRTRALIFAVIARSLGGPFSQEEAARLLVELDFGPERLEPVLAHLSSPDLSDTERAILPFARETTRYQAAEIQRRARMLRDRIGEEAFVETVGLCGLANMLCRLEVVNKAGKGE